MEKLAKREEQIMQVFWSLGKAFIKEIVDEMPEPKPHYNSAATIVKILERKGFLSHVVYGKTFQYQPVVSVEAYKNSLMNSVVKKYFDNSYPDMLAYFVKNEKISEVDLKRILELIKSKND